jgi:hypothetical protein
MQAANEENLQAEVFTICKKLEKMVPPVNLKSVKADEIISYWLPEVNPETIKKLKFAYLNKTNP